MLTFTNRFKSKLYSLTEEMPSSRISPDAEIAQLVEHATENCGVSGSTPLLGTIFTAEVAEWVDAAVSKTVGG